MVLVCLIRRMIWLHQTHVHHAKFLELTQIGGVDRSICVRRLPHRDAVTRWFAGGPVRLSGGLASASPPARETMTHVSAVVGPGIDHWIGQVLGATMTTVPGGNDLAVVVRS